MAAWTQLGEFQGRCRFKTWLFGIALNLGANSVRRERKLQGRCAALETEDGRIITGCNCESASYGLTICAERVAVVKAHSEGIRRAVRVAVVADTQEPTPPSLLQRINGIAGREWSNTLDAPTATQRRQYEVVAAEFGGVLEKLRGLVEGDVKRLEDRAEAAGAPWTSGRIPTWKP